MLQPSLGGSSGCHTASQPVRSNGQVMGAIRCAGHKAGPTLGTQAVRLQQPGDPIFTAPLALCFEFGGQAWTAIANGRSPSQVLDARQQPCIGLLAGGRRPLAPSIIACAADAQDAAELTHRVILFQVTNALVTCAHGVETIPNVFF